jgi:RES domain-containing protein
MIVYRLCKAEYTGDLSGEGARKFGGRWNSKGTAMVYAAESRALCTAELAVHLALGILPKGYRMISILIPDHTKIGEIDKNELPDDWKSFPYQPCTQEMGDAFIQKLEFAVMKVPSAVVPGDHSYLLNPSHPEFKGTRIIHSEPFDFDERLFLK